MRPASSHGPRPAHSRSVPKRNKREGAKTSVLPHVGTFHRPGHVPAAGHTAGEAKRCGTSPEPPARGCPEHRLEEAEVAHAARDGRCLHGLGSSPSPLCEPALSLRRGPTPSQGFGSRGGPGRPAGTVHQTPCPVSRDPRKHTWPVVSTSPGRRPLPALETWASAVLGNTCLQQKCMTGLTWPLRR